jgi:hypothetical protein
MRTGQNKTKTKPKIIIINAKKDWDRRFFAINEISRRVTK